MQSPEGLENTPFTSLTREPSYSSFFLDWCTDLKEVKRSFSRSLRPNFGLHIVKTRFHLEFSSFWIARLFDLGSLKNGISKYFDNGLKSMQIFQRLMEGMNRRYSSHLNQMSSAVRSEEWGQKMAIWGYLQNYIFDWIEGRGKKKPENVLK